MTTLVKTGSENSLTYIDPYLNDPVNHKQKVKIVNFGLSKGLTTRLNME